MRILDRITPASLWLLGLVFCVANLWYAASRSTIPLNLDGTVTAKRVGTEKHPGLDDAYMVAVNHGALICIDKLPFDAVEIGDYVTKRAWESELRVSGDIVSLTWSRDFHGLVWWLLAAVVIMSLMILLTSSPYHPLQQS